MLKGELSVRVATVVGVREQAGECLRRDWGQGLICVDSAVPSSGICLLLAVTWFHGPHSLKQFSNIRHWLNQD